MPRKVFPGTLPGPTGFLTVCFAVKLTEEGSWVGEAVLKMLRYFRNSILIFKVVFYVSAYIYNII